MALPLLKIIDILIIFILLFFTILLFNVGRHTRSNNYLGVYFIGQIIVLFNMAFSFYPIVVYCLLQSIIFSWGAFYFMFVSSLLNPRFKFKLISLLHLIPVPIGFFLLFVELDQQSNLFFQKNIPFIGLHSKDIQDMMFNVLIIGYNIATVSKYYQFRKSLKKGESTENTLHPIWLKVSIWGFVFSCFIVQIGRQLYQSFPSSTFDMRIIGLSTFLIYFCVLFYMAISSRVLLEKTENKIKYKNSKLPESDALLLLSSLEGLMEREKLFTNQELKLKEIAELLHTSERNLSLIVNKYKNQNFSDYINSFRINYAMLLLANPQFQDKTILWILFESGFSSKTSFNTTFKKVVGFTPVEFRKRNMAF